VPVRIYTSSGDREVPMFNSTYCQQRLGRHGAQAELPRVLAEFD
jgi:hypothetical protein